MRLPAPLVSQEQQDCARRLRLPVFRDVDLVRVSLLGRLFGNALRLRMVLIAPGEFEMGSPDSEAGRSPCEGPRHRVRITAPFYLGVHLVTQAQFRTVVGENPSWFIDYHDRAHSESLNPVERVSWQDAQDFCEALAARAGFPVRLPTEAEWEYACRAGTQTPFWFGETLAPAQANFEAGSAYTGPARLPDRERTTPVTACPPNPWGLYDMHGNLWEWCADWFGEDYYERSPEPDPPGPPEGKWHILRGGCWDAGAHSLRSAARLFLPPTIRFFRFGFRVAASLPPPAPTPAGLPGR